MRWKLLRRRLSVSAPRMIVRSHLPWPLRWALVAVTLGFSASIALWAFELGKSLAGLDRGAQAELARLRVDVDQLRIERENAQSIANTAESLLKAERTAQVQIAQQLKQAEAENLALKADLMFLERLMPAAASDGLNIRALRADIPSAARLHFQALLMQSGRSQPEFSGRYEVVLSGTRDGQPWNFPQPGGPKPLQVRQSLRLEGLLDVPSNATVKQLQLKVLDARGAVKASQILKL